MHSPSRYIQVKADIAWMVCVVILRYVGMFASGLLIPQSAEYLDWGMLAIWFSWLSAIDLVCVILLLGSPRAKFLIASLYVSFAWSVILAVESDLSSDYLIQADRYVQIAIFIALMAALVAGVMECRGSRPQSSSSRS